MQDKIFEILFDKDDVTWKTIIHELIKTEQMNVWDVDVSLLTQRYIDTIKKMKELDFRVSGKVLLAAALLLKMKSDRLVGEDILQFDRLLDPESGNEGDFFEEELNLDPGRKIDKANLIPRTPQPRKRKVSIYDLMNALEKALEVKKRRVMRDIPPMMEAPRKTRDITEVIKEMYGKIKSFLFQKKERLTFSKLAPSDKKEDRIYAFTPLLHLSNQQKVSLSQKKHFGEIEVMIKAKQEVEKELNER
jgi:segregation and condensation protein A|tara:strand:- start:154 stop:894 length:741 start_codon:yes stop_codon:yes gene_type:complete